ncbi:MAG: glycoside hydrolase family 97 protein [Bacteroidetes bacterium]|nr:glycoside hydrolase family 97 protein [Bacteroidota bacterium]
MRRLLVLFPFIYFFGITLGFAQKNLRISSPDGNIVFSFKITSAAPVYSILFKGKTLIADSPLGLQFDDGDFSKHLVAGKAFYRDTTEAYELVVGKTKKVVTRYRELIIPLKEKNAAAAKVNFIVRAFDEGIAFRYQFLPQAGKSSFTLLDENSSFNLVNHPVANTLFLPSFTSSHEGFYTTIPVNDIKPDTLMDMPTLFEYPGKIYIAITEAALSNYAGMYLMKHNGILKSQLSPLPGQTAIKVKAELPHKSPWRVLMISDRVGALIESNILTSLNEPCKIEDVSWIKPGKTTFPWWNGNVVPDTINAPGNNFVTNKYYIDFCARNNIGYHSVVEYGLHEWYTNDGGGFQPGPHADVTKPVAGIDMKEICDYAHSKGVDVRVWVHFYALYPKLDTAFALFEKWGLSGMMVDFMDRDDQQMVQMQEEILQKAAKHHLHIQFHGAYKPTGMHRTYPNEFTREGTLNYEANKWNDIPLSPDHDIYMPFTRMLAGATDYHLGGFRAVPPSQYRMQYTRPLMGGTRCHMLAMYVVLESYLGMVCDYPEAYEGQPGFEFIKEVPTVWDETKVINAEINQFITIARRKNKDWYIGTINNHEAREITVPLDFLGEGNYTAELYSDAKDVKENPNHLEKKEIAVTKKDILKVKIAGGGGMVMKIREKL